MSELQTFRQKWSELTDFRENPYHPLVWMNGEAEIDEGTFVGAFSEIYSKGARVKIGKYCDIASFVAINVADSHLRCIGLAETNICRDITIGDYVFIGSHSAILGGAVIGHHSVIGAGTIVHKKVIPPYSLVIKDLLKPGYYKAEYELKHGKYTG